MTYGSKTSAINPELTNEKVERIYHAWDAALAHLIGLNATFSRDRNEMRPFI
jgi:hypothetical protein